MISPTRIVTLAGNTVREAVRDKVLYTLLGFAVVLIATGVLLAALSYVERERILQDVGLGATRLFGAAIAINVHEVVTFESSACDDILRAWPELGLAVKRGGDGVLERPQGQEDQQRH